MKEHEVVQGLEELWGKAPMTADFRDVISTPPTSEQDQDYEELEEFENDKEKQEACEIIQGLEELWGKAPVPVDFREVILYSDWPQPYRSRNSGPVISMADHRRKRELLQSGISLGGVLAACLVLALSWSLRDSAVDNAALTELTETVRENATDNAVVAGLTTTIREQQVDLLDVTYKLAWVTTALARDRAETMVVDFDPEAAEVEKVSPEKIRAKYVLAGRHFERAAKLEANRAARLDRRFEAAIVYRDACKLEKAVTLLQEIVDGGGGSEHGKAEVLLNLGAIFQISKEYAKAASQYEAAFDQALDEENEEWQEKAAFNLALMYAALFAESSKPHHLQGALTALDKSIDIGDKKRLEEVRKVQAVSKIVPNVVCPAYPWVEDLSVVAEEPAFREFLEAQSNRRWL